MQKTSKRDNNIVFRKLLSIFVIFMLIITSFVVFYVEPVSADSLTVNQRAIPGFNAWDGNNLTQQSSCSIINNTGKTSSFYYGNTADIEFNGTIVGTDTCYLYCPQYNTTFDTGSGNYEVFTNWSKYSDTAISAADLTLENVYLNISGLWLLIADDATTLWHVNMSNMSICDPPSSDNWEKIVGWFWVNSSFPWSMNLSRSVVLYDNNDSMNITFYDSNWDPISSSCFVDVWKVDNQAPGIGDYNLSYHKELTAGSNGLWEINGSVMYTMTHNIGPGTYIIRAYEDIEPGHSSALNIYGNTGGSNYQGTRGYNTTFGYTDTGNWSGRFIEAGSTTQIRSYMSEPVNNTWWQDTNTDTTTYRWETCGPFNPPEIWVNSTYLYVLNKNATFKGYVNDSYQSPLEGVNVSASHNSYGLVNYTLTDANGYYELNLTSGVYNVSYFKNMYDPNWSDENIADSGINWTNLSLSGGSGPQGSYFVNQWNATMNTQYITNCSGKKFNFTFYRECGQENMRINNITIHLPSGFTYVENNGTTLGNGEPTEFRINHTANRISWIKTNSQGFLYNASENFWFVANATRTLGSDTFNISVLGSTGTYQNFTKTVFVTMNFSFTGSVKNITGSVLEGAIASFATNSFSSQESVNFGTFSDTTNSTGHFNITGVPTIYDPAEPGQGAPSGSASIFYQLSAKEVLPGTPYAINISPSLPSLGYTELTSMMNNPEMYLKKAMTFKVDVIGPTWNWSTASIDGYGSKDFQIMAKDLALGYSAQENNTEASMHLLSVPANRNYSFSIFPSSSFPVSIRLNNVHSRCTNGDDLNQTGVVVDYWGFNGTFLINVTVNASYSQKYINGTFDGISGTLSSMRVVAYVMEDEDMVFENWALPHNLGNESGKPNDFYELATGEYNISLPATNATSYFMLRAYAVDTDGIYYADSAIINGSGLNLSINQHNFTMAPLVNGSNRSISSNNVTAQWNQTTIVNTTAVLFNLTNGSALLSNENSFIEIKRTLSDGTVYTQMTDASNGQFNVSLKQGESIKKLTIYSQLYAPISVRVSDEVINGSVNTSQINCTNGYCNITMRSFGEFDPLDENQDFEMAIYKSNASCNVPDPPEYCDLCAEQGGEMNESEFSPFNAILKGDINLMISSENISVYYINVDLLASGPPDAAFSNTADQSSSGLEAAWQFGSQGPDIYDYVFLKVPYPQLFDDRNITVKINKLFDNDFNTVWNTSLGHNITQIQNWDNLSEYSDYLNTSYEAYFNGTGVFCDPSNTLMQNGLGYKDVTNHKLWMKILHFSGLGPTIFYSGGNQSYLLNESPTNNLANIDPFPPSLYVLCIDNDTADTMNATWSSNSSGSWVTFATNTSIANNTNITQINLNFSSPGTKYWWRVNLTDGTNWYNQTYAFTTNYDPYQNGESPVNEVTKASTTPSLYVVCNDNDTGDTMTAYWYYNDSSTGKWYLFGTNSSVSSGTNITQDNSNFSNHSTTYYWSVNLTDGNNWSNITYSFTTNYAPTQTGKAPTSGSNYVNTTPDLYVIVTDLDSDTMTAYWWYNVSDSWWQFATNSSITSGTNITQTNSNFSNNSEACYWSVNVTDGTNWTNSTNSFTTRSQYLPDAPTSFTATAAGTSSISLSWTIGTNSNYTRIQRSTSTYPTSISSGTSVYNSTGSSKTDSGLSSGTKYYYSAWSYNSTGNEWSVTYATASATTSSPSGGSPGSPPAPPTVVTSGIVISSVTHTPTTVTSSDTVNVTATITASSGVYKARVYYTVDDTLYSVTMSNTTESAYYGNIGPFADGKTVTYYIHVTDQFANTKDSSTYSFSLADSTAPSIDSVTPSDGSSTSNLRPEIKAEYSDSGGIDTSSVKLTFNGVDVTSGSTVTASYVSYTPTEDLTYATYSATVEISDITGNSNSKTWTFTVESGTQQTTQIIDEIPVGGTETWENTQEDSKIEQISLTAANKLEKVQLSVTTQGSKPSTVTESPTQTVYLYLVIETNKTASDISEAAIGFKIDQAWFTQNSIDKDTVKLLRYVDDTWTELATTKSNEDNDYVYYSATTTGFSVFAIVGTPIIEEPGEGLPIWIYIMIVVVIIILIIGMLFKTGYLYVEEESSEKKEQKTKKKNGNKKSKK